MPFSYAGSSKASRTIKKQVAEVLRKTNTGTATAAQQAPLRAMMTTDFDVILREVHSDAAGAEPDAAPSSLATDGDDLGAMPGNHDELAAELELAFADNNNELAQ